MEALGTLGHYLVTVVVGLVVLTVLVYVHELGHYLAAKRMGMDVKAFAIFMGGVRKTDLQPWVKAPLAPARTVAIVLAVTFAAVLVGAVAKLTPLYYFGLVATGIAVPVWVMFRLASLYHVSPWKVLGTLGKSLGVAAVVLFFGTRFQGVDPNMLVGVATGATLIALMIVYYIPIGQREAEDDKQGFGEITVPSREGGTEKVPVRFRPLWHRTGKDGTEFSLLLLPLGGFALISGMHAKPDGSEVNVERGFYSKGPWQRLLVLFAGPFFSVAFGMAVLIALFLFVGKPEPDLRPVVSEFGKGSAAQAAGLQIGDEIIAIDGEPVADFGRMTQLVHDNWKETPDGKREAVPTRVTYRRDGVASEVTVVPNVTEEPEPLYDLKMEQTDKKAYQARLGVAFGQKLVAVPVSAAIAEAVDAPVVMVTSLASMVVKPSSAGEQVAGPTTMAKVTSAAVKSGPYYVIWFAAMLSISLGILNLLPIVPLDGGQMVVAFVEMFRGGRRLSIQMQQILANTGIGLLVLLFLAASAVDLGRNAKENEKTEQAQGK